MGEKILTISVAAYNVEKTLRETLDSLVVPEIMDKLEVFVVDDGGTDETLNIAREYEAKYPGTFHAVHKENGGYGSTVNWSVAHATGKYIKLLDGDDWYATENLAAFIALLEEVDTDGVISRYISRHMRSGKSVQYKLCSDENGIYPIDGLHLNRWFNIYFLAWKTDLLRNMDLKIREHCMYTDTQFAYYPVCHANDIYCWDLPIYIYRTEVSGQTMSIEGKLKYKTDYYSVYYELMNFYKSLTVSNSSILNAYIYKLGGMATDYIRLWCWMEPSAENKKSLKSFVGRLKKEAPEVLSAAMRQSKLVSALVSTNLIIYPFVHRYCLWKARRSRGGGD